jgi:phospholipid/cholesterol/gamma-HCH transport system substrate-binding protein
MAVTRAQKVRLGIFLLVSTSLLVGVLVVLAGLKLVQRRDHYTVRFTDSVSGLENGAQVKYNGVRVGTVQDIRINPDDVSEVIIGLSLERGTPIKSDTRAVLQTAGITGLKFIELQRGSPTSKLLEPGAEIPAGASFLDRITGQAEVIAEKAELLVNNLNGVLGPENRQRISNVLANVEDLSAAAVQAVDENRENLRAFSQGLAELAAGLDARVANLEGAAVATLDSVRLAADSLGATVDRAKVDQILGNLQRLTGDLRTKVRAADLDGLVRELDQLAKSANRLVGNVDLVVLKSREDLYASLNYLLEGLENFSEFARMLRENPSLLLKGPDQETREF